MGEPRRAVPDHTAVRVALWRALHVRADAPPHVLGDEIGLELADPGPGWRERGDMTMPGVAGVRASVVARARFVEDLVAERVAEGGVTQYVILGAGLDTFAQRRPEPGASIRVFEVDQPGTQMWKRRRLAELGYATPPWLTFVPVDFEAGDSWWERLTAAGFDRGAPAVVASTGVSMYLSHEANVATLRQAAALAPGSAFASTFLPPLDLLEPEQRQVQEMSMRNAAASGTPFVSLYAPEEMRRAALEAGFAKAAHVSPDELAERYFAGRPDGLRPPRAEQFLVAEV
ncbi:class I SAM-dependent methyltransferase [Streptomyces mobaraensis NBRC 13819 = DSM 40847]|uniref:S-adenosyl-L-methionine-dependent methyltransferase n=2 Tax=Streptomyces mobaraensis TaxID=35621 RepID=A0A5N5WF51_STRMB|nr:class I SAM-dependent methyltransferase [Streptomyces mobaraensis]EME99828.1 putative methyltransferase [Streptomyces mobaraensis NBRC 13819 = DSM 40847]KAB7852675.1 class I SAM-dependent methyltransferase [Streptomyces mobaraensis]QTT75194.1 class I SAM-dependent methyltransferase [Streptomyces mobaraensis NBRC 13819 = DSM 40847]